MRPDAVSVDAALRRVVAAGGAVVIHFGMPKTGSTSIQASLYEHLEDPRFHYVDFGAANPNRFIVTGFPSDPRRFRLHKRLEMPDAELASMRQFARTKLKQELLRSMQQTSILSSESVYGLTREEFQSLVDHIRRFRRKVWAVGYVRHPKEYIESQFQQTIKSHDTASLDLESYFPRYRRQLEKLDNVVGADRVRLWLFDPGAFPRGCVVSDFCARLGLDFNPARVIRTNEGLSLPAVRLLYIYRKYGPGYGSGREALQANRELVRSLTELPGPKLRFHSSLMRPVIERRRDELAWFAARTGIDLVEDLERHDDVAVRSEADLLNIGSDELAWLQAQLGHDRSAVPDREDTRCAYAAECMHCA